MTNIIFLSYNVGINLLTIPTFIFSGANGYELCKSCNSFGYSKSTSIIYPFLLLDFQFSNLAIIFSFLVSQ